MSISRIKNQISEAATEACGYSPLTRVVSEEEINRILEQESGWIPVDEQIPNTDKYILVSFENFTVPDIGRYETDEDGNGAFYPGDDDKSYAKYGLFVNAWMPLPEPYMESEESHECIRTAARDSKTERIKVSCLDIIVTMIGKKPYYEIKYKEIGEDYYHVGYSSYKLENVLAWKDECFEIVKECRPQTNADRIRSMTDEELLDFLCSIETYEQGSVKTIEGGVAMCSVTEVEQWLKAESEE